MYSSWARGFGLQCLANALHGAQFLRLYWTLGLLVLNRALQGKGKGDGKGGKGSGEVCRNFLRGYCKFGASCHHIHSKEPQSGSAVLTPPHTRMRTARIRLLASARTRCRAHSALRRIRRTELARQYMGLRAQHRAAPADAGDVSHARKKPTLLQMVRRVAFLERL